jgi:hypothetical protein
MTPVMIVVNGRQGLKFRTNDGAIKFQPNSLVIGDIMDIEYRPTHGNLFIDPIEFFTVEFESEEQIVRVFFKLKELLGKDFQRVENTNYLGGYEYKLYSDNPNKPWQKEFIGTLTIRSKDIDLQQEF